MASTTLGEFRSLVEAGYNVVPLHTTLQLDRETPVSLYQRFHSGRAIFLLESAALGDDTGRYSFIGLDRVWRVTTRAGATVCEGIDPPLQGDLQPLALLRSLLARYPTYSPADLPDFFGGAVGFVTYDYVRRLERLPRTLDAEGWPEIDFSFPSAVLICDHLRHSTTVVVNALVEDGPDAESAYTSATERLAEIVATLLSVAPPSDPLAEQIVATAPNARTTIDIRSIAAELSNFSANDYGDVVNRAKQYVYAGDIFQVVPSQQFQRPTSVDPLTLYRVLRSLNPSPYMYLLDSGENQIVGASPEMLIRVHDREVTTRPIAGTRPRGVNEAEDAALEYEILHDEKEIAEHVMLVDLGRNDVGRVAVPGTV